MQIELSEDDVARYNSLYEGAIKRLRAHVFIDGQLESGRPGWIARQRLKRAIIDFKEALAIAPFKWECHFWIGKGLQRLGDHKEAMGCFIEALKLEPDNPTIAKEAANEALSLEEYKTGIALLRPATLQNPADPVLHYDLAIHLLLSGDARAAYDSLQRAARIEAHPFTGRLLSTVEAILSGRRDYPRSMAELERGT